MLIKKKDTPNVDYESLSKVGIDDFAIKKRHTYGTIMINHQTKTIVDMIPSREINDLNIWLSKFINLNTISRDGSVIYKNAIDISLPQVKQISDRFHLLKGLSEAISSEIKSKYDRVLVESYELSFKDKQTIKDRFDFIKNDIKNGICVSTACSNNKLDIRLFKKLEKMSDSELTTYFSKKDKNDLKIEENRKRKSKLINDVRDFYSKSKSLSKTAKEFGIDRRTVSHYLSDQYVDLLFFEDKNFGSKSKLDDYQKDIFELLNNKCSIKQVFITLKEKGYKGSYSNLRMYLRRLRKQNKLTLDSYVEKRDILNLLYHEKSDDLLPRKYLNIVFSKYPIVKEYLSIFLEFKSILLNIKKQKYLDKWIIKASRLGTKSIISFVRGIKRDYDAVINSFLHDESNGIVESKVNTTKLTKRIMYGRSSFELIKNKTMRLQSLRQ